MKNILVTGGAGFIGSHIVPCLLQHGYTQVTVLDNLSTGSRQHVPAGVELVPMDMCSPELFSFMESRHFTDVIHLAAQTLVPYSMSHPEQDSSENVAGLVHVLEGCRRSGVSRILFSSSAAVYGDNQKLPLLETERPQPTSFYGLTKAIGEAYIRMYCKVFGFSGVIFRFANVYGPRQGESGEGGVISIFAKKLAKGQPVTVFGDGNQTRDFVYVGDIAEAMCHGLEYSGVGTFNVSTNQEVSLNELIRTLEQVSGRKLQVQYGPKRVGDIYASVLSHKAICEELGMTQFTNLETGLSKTMDYFQRAYGEAETGGRP